MSFYTLESKFSYSGIKYILLLGQMCQSWIFGSIFWHLKRSPHLKLPFQKGNQWAVSGFAFDLAICPTRLRWICTWFPRAVPSNWGRSEHAAKACAFFGTSPWIWGWVGLHIEPEEHQRMYFITLPCSLGRTKRRKPMQLSTWPLGKIIGKS